MSDHAKGQAIGPNGTALTLDDLPAPDTARWVPRRKAEVVAAIEGGLLSRDAAIARYRLSEEELDEWYQALSQGGLGRLRVTHLTRFRAGAG